MNAFGSHRPAGLSSSTLPPPAVLFTAPKPSWRRLPHVPAVRAPAPGQRDVSCSGLGDSWKAFMKSIEFENWAPRSSRTWRLGQQPIRPGELQESDMEVLNQRLAGARREGVGSLLAEEDEDVGEAAAGDASDATAAATAGERQSAAGSRPQQGEGGGESAFTRSTDEDFADALNRRIVEVAPALSMDDGGEEGEGTADVLTGARLRELVVGKYGKAHDLAFVRRDLPLGKTLVSLNIMFAHLGQRSFPLSETSYNEKLDGMSYLLRAWEQDEKVMAFLKEPAKSRHGLPARPIVGTAISIQLDLDPATISEWFPQK